jgi:hypothetical protein
MRIVSKKQIEAVFKLSPAKRYGHSIKIIAEEELVWGLYNDGWAMAATNSDNQSVFPIWPLKEYAEVCISGDWLNYEPKSICLYEFIDDYLASFREDNILPCIFYGTEDQGMLADIDMLIADIEDECLKYD